MPKILPKIPSVELPRANDVSSIVNSILQLKEAVELLSGQRGNKYFASMEDISQLLTKTKALETDTPWQTIYNQSFSGVVGQMLIPDLSEYRMLRVKGYARPTNNDRLFGIQLGLIGGGMVSAATEYNNTLMYTSSIAPTTISGSQLVTGHVALTFTNPIQAINTYALRFDLNFEHFNQTGQKTMWGHVDYYTGTLLHQGFLHMRPATGGLGGVGCDRFQLFCGGAGTDVFSGHMLVEGVKG